MRVAWLLLQIITNFQMPFEPTPICSYTTITKRTSELPSQLFPRCRAPLEKVIVPETRKFITTIITANTAPCPGHKNKNNRTYNGGNIINNINMLLLLLMMMIIMVVII
jgi:hypothetical protein